MRERQTRGFDRLINGIDGYSTTRKVPHVGGNPSAWADYARHFRSSQRGGGKKRDNQGHDGDIEAAGVECQFLRVAESKFRRLRSASCPR